MSTEPLFSAEISAIGQETVIIQNNSGLTVLAILGPRGGTLGKVWLDERQAVLVATAIMKSYQKA